MANLKAHVVCQGEYLTQIAWRLGVDPNDIWNHPKNADLQGQRKDMDMLCPGDVLYVSMDPPPSAPCVGGASNNYSADIPTVVVGFVLRNGKEPFADEAYVVHGLDDSDATKGTTDSDGKLTVSVPILLRTLVIELTDKQQFFAVAVGNMDCINSDSGVQMRLDNLGYVSDDDGEWGDAIKTFQQDSGLDATGEMDEATRSALESAYGS